CFAAASSSIYLYTLSLHDALPIYVCVPAVVEDRVERVGVAKPAEDPLRRFVVRLLGVEITTGLGGDPPCQQRQRERRPVVEELRSEEHTSELQSLRHLVCRLLLEK